MRKAQLTLLLLLVTCFSLAAWLHPRHEAWVNEHEQAGSALAALLGDGRKMVADYFYVQADVYFHSGYYPSVFDQARKQEEQDSDVSHPEEEVHDEHEGGFRGPPRDWIDSFSRHFRPSRHTHLEGAAVQEMLPWMRLSADLDPQRIQTYTVTAYFLRSLGKLDEAADFLREGLRANPNSTELMYELGQVFFENKDLLRAKNVWLGALRSWHQVEEPKPEKTETGEGERDTRLLEKILVALANEEAQAGRTAEAIEYFKQAKPFSPNPNDVQKRIDELQGTAPRSGGGTNQSPIH